MNELRIEITGRRVALECPHGSAVAFGPLDYALAWYQRDVCGTCQPAAGGPQTRPAAPAGHRARPPAAYRI